MHFEDFPTEFDRRVRARSLKIDSLGIAEAMALMVAFYRDEPVSGIAPPPDDHLKFSWGVRDRGEGDHFEVNLARVVSTRREGAPPLAREFELTFRLTASPELRGLPRNEVWCYSVPELKVFEQQVRDTEAYAVLQRDTILSVSVLLAGGAS